MTTFGQNIGYTVVAASAISQFRGVTIAGAYATTGLLFYGVNQEKPSTGDHFRAIVFGESKVQVSSGGLAVGDEVSFVASGFATKCGSGYWSAGRCQTAATSGGIANVYFYGGPTYINA